MTGDQFYDALRRRLGTAEIVRNDFLHRPDDYVINVFLCDDKDPYRCVTVEKKTGRGYGVGMVREAADGWTGPDEIVADAQRALERVVELFATL
jgi:hypothetical protein